MHVAEGDGSTAAIQNSINPFIRHPGQSHERGAHEREEDHGVEVGPAAEKNVVGEENVPEKPGEEEEAGERMKVEG
jgi:hypothetical protein